ncbi:MAG TPA: hypothetical protein VLG92_03935 [Candidatus Saccharimonadia bacterium]|nr:hypothetical protein [Candidatus Saccharimonadia bacterium]
MKLLKSLSSNRRYAAFGLILGFAALFSAATATLQPTKASAQSCDKVNIVYCGLSGSTIDNYISAFKANYSRGNDNGHSDLQAIYNWAGANSTSVAGMNSSNTKLGTMYRDGTIVVDGTTIGNTAWVSARFNSGSGFVQITSGVWARKTTTSLAEASAPVIVHFNGSGVADFAAMTGCGNAVKFTPIPPKPQPQPPKPQPKPALACVILAKDTSDNRSYTFTAKASASNTTITSYTFTYSDGTTKTVPSSAITVQDTHTFAGDNQHYTVSVAVNSTDLQNVTSAPCQVSLTTPGPQECKPGVPVGSPACAPTCQEDSSLPQCTPPTPPTPPTLPKTGAGDTIGLVGAVVVIAGIGHQFFLRKVRG